MIEAPDNDPFWHTVAPGDPDPTEDGSRYVIPECGARNIGAPQFPFELRCVRKHHTDRIHVAVRNGAIIAVWGAVT